MLKCLAFAHIFLASLVLVAQTKYLEAESHYEEAYESYRSGSLNDALQSIDKAINLRSNADMYYLQGLIFEATDKPLRATSSFEACLRYDKDYLEAVFQKGLLYLRYGDPGQAVKDFSRLISIDKISETRSIYFQIDPSGETQNRVGTLENFKAKIFHYRGQAYHKLGEYEDAIADYEAALSLESTPDVFVSKGLLLQKQKREELAIVEFKRAIELDSTSALAWYNLALLDSSVEIPEEFHAGDGFGPTLSLLAARALEQMEYHKAKRYFDLSIENNKSDPLTYINRGRVSSKLQNFGAARADFLKAKELDQQRFETLYLIGNTYFFEKTYDMALAYYDQYLVVDPENALIWYNGAMSKLELEQIDEACFYLRKSKDLGMVQAKRIIDNHCKEYSSSNQKSLKNSGL